MIYFLLLPSLQVNSLNSKVRALKRDKEEVEGELETSKSRLRQMRSQLEDAEESASTLQAQISKLRTANRKKVLYMNNPCFSSSNPYSTSTMIYVTVSEENVV